MLQKYLFFTLIIFSILFTGCDSNDSGGVQEDQKTLYTLNNDSTNNQVIAFTRADDGSLSRLGSFDTNGQGGRVLPQFEINPLDSQDALIVGPKNQYLYAVNNSSNDISAFSINQDGSLTFINKVPSGGEAPISLTAHENLLYVLNARGNGGNINGYRIEDDGSLSALTGSTQPLSGKNTPLPGSIVLPSEVQFSPDGNFLVVTEKATSLIDIYTVGSDGIPSAPQPQKSQVPTPFGMAFDQSGHLIVSNVNGKGIRKPRIDSSSVSTYDISAQGTITPITEPNGTMLTAACWVVVSNDGRFAYDTNTGSGNISGFRINDDGSLELLNPSDGLTASTGPNSITLDMAVSDNYFYVLSVGNQEIDGFQINGDGSLTRIQSATGTNLPKTGDGLAAN